MDIGFEMPFLTSSWSAIPNMVGGEIMCVLILGEAERTSSSTLRCRAVSGTELMRSISKSE